MSEKEYSGLTERKYFAAHAPITLADAVAACGWDVGFVPTTDSERATVFAIMKLMRYEYADAMLS